jgi:hypothetical protein
MIADAAALDEFSHPTAARLDWPLLEQLPALLTEGEYSASSCRQLLERSQQELQERFRAEEPIEALDCGGRLRARRAAPLLRCRCHGSDARILERS